MRILVAFASSDGSVIDAHFGSTPLLLRYEITAAVAQECGRTAFAPAAQDGNEDKLGVRIAALSGCDALYCLKIGASAVRQLLAVGVHPVPLAQPQAIEVTVAQLQAALRNGSLPWAAMRRPVRDPNRFAAMLAQGWKGD